MLALRTLRAGNLTAEIVPDLGGGVARLDLLRDGQRLPLLGPWPERGTRDPNCLACYVLVPWSNRLSQRGVVADVRFFPLPNTLAGEPYPIHGDGWQRPWRVAQQDDAAIVLEYESRALPPFAYVARLAYRLSERALTMTLHVTHLDPGKVAYGLGFHPWLPRTSDTIFCAPASQVWLENEAHLPTIRMPVTARQEWNFGAPAPLPPGWINACFEGWGGEARITWPRRALELSISASANLSRYIVYSPGEAADFFCFEPVSHRIDAHAEADPEAAGLVLLGRDQEAACRITLSVP